MLISELESNTGIGKDLLKEKIQKKIQLQKRKFGLFNQVLWEI